MSGYGGPDDEATNAQAFIDNYVSLAISQLPTGESALFCVECSCVIPEKRRLVLQGVKRCVSCQQAIEKKQPKVKIVTITYML